MTTLMTHIVAGYPTLKASKQIALTMIEAGVSYLEIQIPFSDPVADGPTIRDANQKALEQGVTIENCFELMKTVTSTTKTPILFMTYYNIPFAYGLEAFCKRAHEAGCYGLIIPDIPLDEEPQEHYVELCQKYQLHAIQVVSPITPEERLKKIGTAASGFVYCVSRLGTTGEQKALDPKLYATLQRIRKHINLPLALGFGISTAEQVVAAQKEADIVVMGSKLINLYHESKEPLSALKQFLSKVIAPSFP